MKQYFALIEATDRLLLLLGQALADAWARVTKTSPYVLAISLAIASLPCLALSVYRYPDLLGKLVLGFGSIGLTLLASFLVLAYVAEDQKWRMALPAGLPQLRSFFWRLGRVYALIFISLVAGGVMEYVLWGKESRPGVNPSYFLGFLVLLLLSVCVGACTPKKSE